MKTLSGETDSAPDDGQRVQDGAQAGPAQSAALAITHAMGKPLAPGLYLVATPIGHLSDITLRAIAVLAQADVIYCEDTRHSRTLVQHFGIRTPLKAYHEHNAQTERPRMLAALERGQRIALISDAGTPLVSDPGFKLVREAAERGFDVISIPGPSAVLTALTASGLPTDAFLFAGFLPPKQSARRTRLSELAAVPASLIFFEAPQRAAETLADMADILGPRQACLARELTKLHEDMRRGTLRDIAAFANAEPLKGEIVLITGPPEASETTDDVIADKLAAALETMSLKDAAKAVSDALGVSKTRVYDLGLKAKSAGPRSGP